MPVSYFKNMNSTMWNQFHRISIGCLVGAEVLLFLLSVHFFNFQDVLPQRGRTAFEFFLIAEAMLALVLGVLVSIDGTKNRSAKTRRTTGHLVFFLLSSLILFLMYATTVWVHRTGHIEGFWAGELVQGFAATFAALSAAGLAIFTVQFNSFHERHNGFIAESRTKNDRIRYLFDEIEALVTAFQRSATNENRSIATAAKFALKSDRATLLGRGNALCPVSLMIKIHHDVGTGPNGFQQSLSLIHTVCANTNKELWVVAQLLRSAGDKLRHEFESIGLNSNHLLFDIDFICGVFNQETMDAVADLELHLSDPLRGGIDWELDEQPSHLARIIWAAIYFACVVEGKKMYSSNKSLVNCVNEIVEDGSGRSLFHGKFLDSAKFQLLTQHFHQFISASEHRNALLRHLDEKYRSITGFRDRASDDLSTLYEQWKPLIDKQQNNLSFVLRQELDRATQASAILLVEDIKLEW